MQSLTSTMLGTSPSRFSPTKAQRHSLGIPTEDREAQRLACRYLTQACERALADLRSSLAGASTPSEVRSGLSAADLLADVLMSWRETLRSLD